MTIRFDRGTLRPPKRLPDGRLRVDAHLTRTGVFVYRLADGTERREYRPPEEVFHADALDSFAMVPVTDDHPAGLVTAKNARDVAIGWTGETIRRDGDHVAAAMMFADDRAIAKVDRGKRELSCGYTCDLEETSGVSPEGERYDVIQRNIRGNHVALVDMGRAGPTARLRMDGAAYMVDADPAPKKEQDMDPKDRGALEARLAELAPSRREDAARLDDATLCASVVKAAGFPLPSGWGDRPIAYQSAYALNLKAPAARADSVERRDDLPNAAEKARLAMKARQARAWEDVEPERQDAAPEAPAATADDARQRMSAYNARRWETE